MISEATTSYVQQTDAIIIRDEEVYSSGTIARVEYIANEGHAFERGRHHRLSLLDGYSESELTRLEEIRANIQAYHKTILNNIVDTDLERLDRIVEMQALELKALVTHQTTGNLLSLTRQLEAAMVNRQEYMARQPSRGPQPQPPLSGGKHASELHLLLAHGSHCRPRSRDFLLHRRL